MSARKEKPLTYAQVQYLDRLKRRADARITNSTACALEKRGLITWRYDRLAPWGGEWVLVDGSTPSSDRTARQDSEQPAKGESHE